MSNLINKAKAAVSGHHTTSTNAGTHDTNSANKVDPRVGSDMNHRNNPTSIMGSSTAGYGTTTTGPTASSTNAGPTPRIPTSNMGSSTPGYGTATTGTTAGSTNAGPHSSNVVNKADPRVDSDMGHRANPTSTISDNTSYDTTPTGTGIGSGTTGTNAHHASTTPGSGSTHQTAGPHNSNLLNKLDPH